MARPLKMCALSNSTRLPLQDRAESLKARASDPAGVAHHIGFRGVTQRVTNPMHPRRTTTGKGGDAEGTPPTNSSVCFPSSSYVRLFLFSMLCL